MFLFFSVLPHVNEGERMEKKRNKDRKKNKDFSYFTLFQKNFQCLKKNEFSAMENFSFFCIIFLKSTQFIQKFFIDFLQKSDAGMKNFFYAKLHGIGIFLSFSTPLRLRLSKTILKNFFLFLFFSFSLFKRKTEFSLFQKFTKNRNSRYGRKKFKITYTKFFK